MLLWRQGVSVWVDSFSKFHIDALVNGGTNDVWRFIGFYGKPDTNARDEAWNMLHMLNSKPHLPWLCMGDYNEILFTKEKHGGRVRPHEQMQAFRDVLDTYGFVDLGFTGLDFTWQGNRHGHVVWERLDRGVANYDWMAKFLQLLLGIFTVLLLIIGQYFSSLIQMVSLLGGNINLFTLRRCGWLIGVVVMLLKRLRRFGLGGNLCIGW